MRNITLTDYLELNNGNHMNNAYENGLKSFGTFADSKKAPIHRWFQYPAGFSYKAVNCALELYNINTNHKVYDPFVGTGTTSLVCKAQGIESYGVEAHPFVVKIAQTKMKWDYDYDDLRRVSDNIIGHLLDMGLEYERENPEMLPELVRKCYSDTNIKKLLKIKSTIDEMVPDVYKSIFDVALIGTLRKASGAATGWPYIAPKKKIQEKEGVKAFIEQLNICINDLELTPVEYRNTISEIKKGDCRDTDYPTDYFDFVFTSPPYLNNYDYADRTRLEAYFMGYVSTWNEITTKVRNELIISATTQILRTKYNTKDIICDELKGANNKIAKELQAKVSDLERIRVTKGGKKSYDIMVGQYFNDMTKSLIDTFCKMKKGSRYLLILGDSAPYGIHIPTETYLGEIGLGIGYSDYKTLQLRTRGGKWKGNTQRHHVPLKESLLILEKE